MTNLTDCDITDLIRFAEAWNELGEGVTGQVLAILDSPDADDVNPAAIRFARERLAGLHEDLDHAFGEYLDRLGGPPQSECPEASVYLPSSGRFAASSVPALLAPASIVVLEGTREILRII